MFFGVYKQIKKMTIIVEFNAKIEKRSESRRFRGMIFFIGKMKDYPVKQFKYDNTDTAYCIAARFEIDRNIEKYFLEYINELTKDFLVEKYVTIKDESNEN